MYSFTAVDPDHKFKGSRDPLGFQKIWSDTGRILIKHLSTVSSNINDFQIWCYAKNFHHRFSNEKKHNFLDFFLKTEQAFAYARNLINIETSFNGKNRVSNKSHHENFTFSIDVKDQILSNQKAYGIYGKYSRPARDMKLTEDDDFEYLFSLDSNEKAHLIFSKILNESVIVMNKDDLRPIAELIKDLNDAKRNFFRKKILIAHDHDLEHPQEKLYKLLKINPTLIKLTNFNLFTFLQAIKNLQISNELKFAITEIEQTEKVLAPLNYHFSKLLTRGIWTYEEIFENEAQTVNHSFKIPEVDQLNNLLSEKNKLKFVRSLIERNQFISKRRDSIGWFRDEGDRLVKLFGDTHFNDDVNFSDYVTNDYSESTYSENSYFIHTYLTLFNQIENKQS